MASFSSAKGSPIWIKFRRLVQNDMSTAVIWSKSKPGVEFQYGGRLGELHGMSSQSHVSYCRVLPLGEFTVSIPEPHAPLQGAVTWRNQRHDRATLQGVIIPSAILKIVSRQFFFVFFMQFGLTSDKGGGKCDWSRLSDCLSIGLLPRLLKNAWVDLDEILRVDRCRDMDELIDF